MPESVNPMPAPTPHYLLPAQVAQGLLSYLGKQPYEDVAGYINVLSNMKQAEFPPKTPADAPATGNNGKGAANPAGKGANK